MGDTAINNNQSINRPRIACLIMAAGNASRFGAIKQLAQLAGKPLISHIIDTATEVFVQDVFCVLGAEAEEVAGVIPESVHRICNADWQMGLGNSIATAVAKVNELLMIEGVFIILADQYRLSSDDLMTMRQEFRTDTIIATKYDNKVGVPALFPRKFFPQLMQLNGEHGAKELLNSNHLSVISISLKNAAFDVDTKASLAQAEQIINNSK